MVGESHYQETLAATARLARTELDEEGEERLCFQAILVREPSNAYDARAVAVYSPVGLVAYAPRGSGGAISWISLPSAAMTERSVVRTSPEESRRRAGALCSTPGPTSSSGKQQIEPASTKNDC